MSATFDTMVNARLKIDKAIENFRSYRDSLGFDQPWMHVEPNLQLLDQDLAAAGLAYKGV